MPVCLPRSQQQTRNRGRECAAQNCAVAASDTNPALLSPTRHSPLTADPGEFLRLDEHPTAARQNFRYLHYSTLI